MNDRYGIVATVDELVRQRGTAGPLKLTPEGAVRTLQSGPFRSAYRGRGMEFDESRAYQPGDDIRAIDWRVTARTGRVHTKLFHEERERPVLLLVDARPMMRFGTRALCVAAARPTWVGDPLPQPVEGRDLMLAVDLSGSMAREDFTVGGRPADRLTVVKEVAEDFVQRRTGDRVGLILFGTRSYLQAPLTFDRPTVATLLDEAEVGLAGEETAIGDAIGTAVMRLRDRPAESRVLVLLTDGASNAGALEPLKAARLAAAVADLDRALYAPGRHPGTPSPWSGKRLWRAFKAVRSGQPSRRKLGPVLPGLYPDFSSADSDTA